MKRIKLLSAGLLLLLLCFPLFPASAADLEGMPITSITLQDDQGRSLPDQDSLLPLIEVKPGDLFSRQAVRKGVGYLYLVGKFRDVRVEAFTDRSGVRLTYMFFPITIVDRIVFRGNHSLPKRDLLEATRGIEGKELREEVFPDIRTNIRTQYEAEGYYNARVNFRVQPSTEPYRAALYIYIKEPPRTVIRELRFKGNEALASQELVRVMRNRKGRPLRTSILLEDDLNAIRGLYTDAGYPAAAAGPVSMAFEDGRAVVEIAVTEGPKVSVLFSGNSAYCAEHFPDLLRFDPDGAGGPAILEEQCAEHFRSLLLIESEHEVTDSVIESSVDKIRKEYLDRGHADVKVEVRKTEGPGTLDLAFTIDEGPRTAVDDILVEGNSVFTTRQVLSMIATERSGWLRPRPYREEVLEKDRDSITEQYAADGYLAAEVRQAVQRTADGRGVVITLKITEGRQTLTGGISFEGNAVFSAAELAQGLKLKPSAPFNDRFLEEDRYRILARYAERGYLYARVEAEKIPAGEASSAAVGRPEVLNVRFRVTEDQQVVIGKVILRGNVATRDPVILRELEPRTGEPYNYELLLKSQQRIYRYGYFSLAKFEPVHPHEKETVKDMLFTVEERPAGAVEFGVGYGTLDRLRGFAEVSHRNLWGTARYASLRVEASDILLRQVLTFQEPWFLGYRYLESKFILARSDSKNINERTREIYYQTRKETASYGVERHYEGLRTSLTYQFENVENYNVQPAAELTPEDSGRVLVSSLNPAVILDKRDDPFNPSKGSLYGLNIKEALKELRSEVDFTKVTVQATWYLPVTGQTIFALSGRAGMGWPHHETAEIPLHERYYLGGNNTVRGYTQDSVGPYNLDASGDRVPTGGSSMVQFNAEVRWNASGGSGFVVFSDAGNVWVRQDIELDDLRASYGVGFRYHTPVGPLRIDYGQKINRQPGESPGELHFSIGQAF